MSKKILVFDTEANGLLDEVTSIHCLAFIDYLTEDKGVLSESLLQKGFVVNLFEDCDYIVGHNIIGYDIPLIKMFYGIDLIDLLGKHAIIDTYLWSLVSYPDRPMPDGCPGVIYNKEAKLSKRIGPHSLEAWGYRVGEKKLEISDWKVYSRRIVDRCLGDISINLKVYQQLCKEMGLNPESPYDLTI